MVKNRKIHLSFYLYQVIRERKKIVTTSKFRFQPCVASKDFAEKKIVQIRKMALATACDLP